MVYLVKKIGGIDDGVQYAMKVMSKTQTIFDLRTKVMEEHDIMKDVTGVPFLMGLKYAFQTNENLHFILSEYIRNLCMAGSRA